MHEYGMLATPVSEKDRTLAGVSTIGGIRSPAPPDALLPGSRLRSSTSSTVQVPCGQVGEIAVRPRIPGAMYDGYWGRPEGIVAVSGAYWHHTGDLCRMDEEGFFSFVDRKSDRLRRRGGRMSDRSKSNW